MTGTEPTRKLAPREHEANARGSALHPRSEAGSRALLACRGHKGGDTRSHNRNHREVISRGNNLSTLQRGSGKRSAALVAVEMRRRGNRGKVRPAAVRAEDRTGTFPRFPPRLEIAPKTRTRDFHISPATAVSLSLKTWPSAACRRGRKGLCCQKARKNRQSKAVGLKKVLDTASLFQRCATRYSSIPTCWDTAGHEAWRY